MNGPFDWFTVSYRALKFWGMILVLVVIGVVGWFYIPVVVERFSGASDKPQASGAVKREGRFSKIHGEVYVRKVNTMVKVPATRVESLEEGDMITTGSNGSAEIILFDGSKFEVKNGTIAVISEVREDPATQQRSTSLKIDEGKTLVSTGEKNVPTSETKLTTDKARVSYGAHTEGGASYDSAQGAMEIFVYSGQAVAVNTDEKNPRRVTLGSDDRVQVGADKQFGEKEKLPPSPRLVSPKPNEPFVTKRAGDFRVTLSWEPTGKGFRYRVQLSDTPNFYELMLNPIVSEGATSYVVTNLKHGIYFWRVTSINQKGVEGQPSLVSRFSVVQELKSTAINIRVDSVKNYGEGPRGVMYLVKGRTDPGVRIRINNEEVLVNGDGSFDHLTKPINASQLVIEGIDLSGTSKRINHPLR